MEKNKEKNARKALLLIFAKIMRCSVDFCPLEFEGPTRAPPRYNLLTIAFPHLFNLPTLEDSERLSFFMLPKCT